MAGNTTAEVGKAIPIVLQIADGAINLYPQAEIRDDTNDLLGTFDLIHIGSGMYKFDYLMPNENYIVVTYITYSDAAHTTEATDYQRDVDTFVKAGYDAQLLAITNNINDAKGVAYETSTDSLNAIRDRGDLAWNFWNWRHQSGPV